MWYYMTFTIIVFSCLQEELYAHQPVEPGPEIIATKGAIWPIPKEIYTEPKQLLLASDFKFKVIGYDCQQLHQALDRYWIMLFATYQMQHKCTKRDKLLLYINIDLKTPCDDNMSINQSSTESYELSVGFDNDSFLKANSIWGILRGLESFSQLIYKEDNKLVLNYTVINDSPRFSHRGIMLDTSRHFIPVDVIYNIIDGMVYNKFNVFHWHIVDDHSFPYQSIVLPELSQRGAYNPFFLVYTVEEIKDIVEYARVRGIRVIVEIDTPGHTRSWGESHPEILSKCIVDGEWTGQYGPFDPTVSSLYNLLQVFFKEILEVFPDHWLHIGADEIDYACWKHHKHIANFIRDHNLQNFTGLEYYYFEKLFDIVDSPDRTFIAWEELFHSNGHRIDKNVVYQTWMDNGYEAAEQITRNGHKVIFSSASWYLSQLVTGGDWKKLYDTDPHLIKGSDKQKKLIIGGEACMWSENVDATNVLTRIWPRACAVAEKLWSPMNADIYDQAAKRLEEHTCRMIQRGIPAQPPNGPGYCP